jgi:hypothetical protein
VLSRAARGVRELVDPEAAFRREFEESYQRDEQKARRRVPDYDRQPEDVKKLLRKGHTMAEIRGFERRGKQLTRQARCKDVAGWQTLDTEQVKIELLAIPPGGKLLFQFPELRAAFVDSAGVIRFLALKEDPAGSVLKKSAAGAIFEWDKRARRIEIVKEGKDASKLLEQLYELACESVEGDIPSSY